MTRCAHFITNVRLEEGGVVRAVLDFCRVFAAAGHPTTLLTCDPADVPRAWLDGGDGLPTVVEIDRPRGPLELLPRSALARLTEVLRDVDVVHLHAPWVTANVQIASVARGLGKPYLLTAHGMLDDWSMNQKRLKKRAFLALVGNRLLRGAARVHCTAQAELDQARRFLPRENGVVLPLLMDLSEYAEPPGPAMARDRFPPLRADVPKLLFLSRVHPKKGVEQLIAAAAVLRKRGRPCTVLIAGPGDPPYVAALEQLAIGEGVAESVHFLDMVRGPLKLSLYEAADVFVLPTSQENFGLVLVEALACRTPVVTTQGVDIWRELQSAGAVIAPANPDAIASAVETVLNHAQRESLGERGRGWVMQHLNPARVAGEYAALYQAVVAESTARR